MRAITSILILTFFSLSSQGQLDSASQSEKEWSPSYKIEAEFEANYGSTDLNNEFIDKLRLILIYFSNLFF